MKLLDPNNNKDAMSTSVGDYLGNEENQEYSGTVAPLRHGCRNSPLSDATTIIYG